MKKISKSYEIQESTTWSSKTFNLNQKSAVLEKKINCYYHHVFRNSGNAKL